MRQSNHSIPLNRLLLQDFCIILRNRSQICQFQYLLRRALSKHIVLFTGFSNHRHSLKLRLKLKNMLDLYLLLIQVIPTEFQHFNVQYVPHVLPLVHNDIVAGPHYLKQHLILILFYTNFPESSLVSH